MTQLVNDPVTTALTYQSLGRPGMAQHRPRVHPESNQNQSRDDQRISQGDPQGVPRGHPSGAPRLGIAQEDPIMDPVMARRWAQESPGR